MKGFVALALIATIIIPITTNSAFAQLTYDINIPTGAGDPSAPFFWQSEKDGSTTGKVTIEVLDFIIWKNADTVPHTVTSGSVPDPDGIFDSSLFGPGKSFRYQFTEVGEYPYFCLVHPWMEGAVTVVESTTTGTQMINNVGVNAGDGKTTFAVEYILDRNLESMMVNEVTNSLTLTLAGQSISDELVIMLPEGLIKNPNAVWVDDVQVTNFEAETSGDITTLMIPLGDNSEEVMIQGTAVVPEFGSMVGIILALSIVTTIVLSGRSQKIGILKF